MRELIFKRLLDLLSVLLGVSVLVFLMIRLIPGDAAQVMLGVSGDASEAQVQQLREKLGLNDPWLSQYLRWLGNMAQGDFGVSIWTGKPVMEDIAQRIGVTAELTFVSLLLALLVSIPAGALMAYFRGSVSDGLMRLITITGVTMPAFWLGALLIFGWAIWFPNWQTLGSIPPLAEDPWAHLQRMFLPTLTCAMPVIASLARIMRSAMIDALGQDYIRTARAKGLGEWTVTFKHALRNALMPVVTIAGLQFGNLISGAVLVETVFSWPGLGTLALDAILGRDYPTLLGVLTFSSMLVIAANLVTDLSYRWIDPRLRGK